MQAWRVHQHGDPAAVFVLDEIPAPTGEDLAALGMHMSGWVPVGPGIEPFTDWVILEMSAAALALPDVTMARGTYPVPVAMPYVSGQEGVGVVIDAAPGRRELLGKRVAAVTIQPFGSLAPIAVGISTMFEVPDSMTDDARGRVPHPRAHRVPRGAPTRAGTRGRDRRGVGRRGWIGHRHRAAVRRGGRRRDRDRRRGREGAGV